MNISESVMEIMIDTRREYNLLSKEELVARKFIDQNGGAAPCGIQLTIQSVFLVHACPSSSII